MPGGFNQASNISLTRTEAATMLKAPQEARKKTMDKTYSILPFEEQPGRDLCPGREGHAIS